MITKTYTHKVMGTVASLSFKSEQSHDFSGVAEEVFKVLDKADEVFSTYRKDSPLMSWRENQNLWLDIVSKNPEMGEILMISREAEEETDGYFIAQLPAGETTVFDPTGLVKGWAVDRAARRLEDLGEASWSLNVGGDILVGGSESFGDWEIGVLDSKDPSKITHKISLQKGAVATSGSYERGDHLYDPKTKTRPTGGSVTVIGDNLLWADIWATALFVGGENLRETFEAKTGWPAIFES